MKKAILTLTALCFAITIALGQQQIIVQLSDETPSHEETIMYNYNSSELCRFHINKSETDAQGNTPVSIRIEKSDDDYLLLLFNRALDKKTLRDNRIFFADNFLGGESVQKIENIDNAEDFVCVSSEYGKRDYRLPEIIVKEGLPYECLVPIHVAKEKKMFLCSKKKKIIESILEISIKISVEDSDPEYPSLKRQCDSLIGVFNDSIKAHAFCTSKLHQTKFDDQIFPYTDEQDFLRYKINDAKTKWTPGSSKYQKYEDLLTLLSSMDIAIEEYKESKYDCGDKTKHKAIHSCRYCKLSLEEIYNKIDKHYKDLYNRKVEKKEILSDVNILFNCCKDPSCAKHAKEWKKGGKLPQKIKERYDQIKAF